MNNSNKKQSTLTGAFDLWSKSNKLIQKNWKVFAILYILPILISMPSTNSSKSNTDTFPYLDSEFWAMELIIVLLMVVAFSVLFVINQAMLYVLELQTSKGMQPTFGRVWQHAKGKIWRLLGLHLVISIIIMAGLIAFVIPGFIFIRRYFLTPYYMLDQDLGIRESMKTSANASKQYSSSVWSVLGVISLFAFVPIFIPYIGGILSTTLLALYSIAPALRYQELKKLV